MASTFYLGAQTTVNYPQRMANYDATFTDGGGNFDQGTEEFGMWANIGNKQSVAFRTFTETGLPSGTATTMSIGDSFTITLSATRAYGVIGLALLSSPSSTSSWADRINNYAVQVNLNGVSGNYDPWEVVSNGGTVNASSIYGSTTAADFNFKFTLSTATTMSVSINNGAETFNVTLNNQNITGYSVYIADDWNGSTNANIYWKPKTEYVYAPPETTWTGATDNNWTDPNNWTAGVPTTASNVIIPNTASNYPTASAAVTVNSVDIGSGASLIANSVFSGTVTYNRNLSTTNWYLISSPVNGQDIDTFISAEDLATGSTSNNIGLASYDNTSEAWSYYQSGATGSGNFVLGSAKSIKLATAGTISFTGTMPVSDLGIQINNNTNGYNLIGNPYPSYIPINTNADSSNNILTINSSKLTEMTLWLWNQATDNYEPINQADQAKYISPAQGFFVKTSGNNTFNFTEAMQSHQTDTFQKLKNNRPEISVMLSDGVDTYSTKIYYINGATTQFDNGYDSTIFDGVTNNFAIYTHLIANSNGENLAIQSLPNTNLDTMIVPVGIIAESEQEISISVNAINIPQGINIYLEDKNDNSFTLLDGTTAYTTTLDENLNGIGRYYIHTTSSTLSNTQVSLTNVSMYITNHNLIINGVHSSGVAKVRMTDLLGKEVINSHFLGARENKVALPYLSTGIYIVQLETLTETLHKKIFIK